MKLFISSILIVLSFFSGYLFSEKKTKKIIQENENAKSYINIEQKWKKLNVTNTNKNVIILVNWEEFGSGKIELE